MIPVSGWFILFSLVLGLVLMAVVLYMDYNNSTEECRDPLILGTNRIVLILGALMFGSSMTLLYCRWNCGSTSSEWTVAYLVFMLILAIVLIICGAIANVQGKKVKCSTVARFSPVIWGIGLIVLIGSLFGMWLEYNIKSSEQLEEDIERLEIKAREDEARAVEAEKRVAAKNRLRQVRARSVQAEERVKKAKRQERKASSEKPTTNRGTPLPSQPPAKRPTLFTPAKPPSPALNIDSSPSPEPVEMTTLDRMRQNRENSFAPSRETSFSSGGGVFNTNAEQREAQRNYSMRRRSQRRGSPGLSVVDGGR